jgi:hypothetical protein
MPTTLTKGEYSMPFKTGEKVSVLLFGSLVEGTIIDTAKDDAGNRAYHVEAPKNDLGAPSKWVKASDVFIIESSEEEKLENEMRRAEAVVELNRSLR